MRSVHSGDCVISLELQSQFYHWIQVEADISLELTIVPKKESERK